MPFVVMVNGWGGPRMLVLLITASSMLSIPSSDSTTSTQEAPRITLPKEAMSTPGMQQ